MTDKKLNLNPKRLITFERRMINNYKSQIQIAAMNDENDYVIWLTNRMGFNQKILDKKITRITRWVTKQNEFYETI